MYFEIRIEPKKTMTAEEILDIVEKAFEPYGGLSAEGVELLDCD